jgi:RNA polymerase sigma factor (sigma-70 family)
MAANRITRVVHNLRRLVAGLAAERSSDQDLLGRFLRSRDEAAFTALVERHGALVLGVCRRVLGNEQDAEDACQATFLVLARKAGSIRKPRSLSSWLHGVACRTAKKLRADLARRRGHLQPLADRIGASEPAEASWREVRAVLDEELQRLPEILQGPLTLCYLEGKTRDEAAQELGWTVSTLRGRLERGRERLRRRLVQRGLTLSGALLAAVLSQATAAATVPAALVVTTARAALAISAGKSAAAGTSVAVTSLAEGVLRAMFMTKIKIVCATVLTLGLLSGGAGWLATPGTGPARAGQELAQLERNLGLPGEEAEIAADPVQAGGNDQPSKEPIKPPASAPVEKKGLAVTVRTGKAVYTTEELVAAEITFRNVSPDSLKLDLVFPALFDGKATPRDEVELVEFIFENVQHKQRWRAPFRRGDTELTEGKLVMVRTIERGKAVTFQTKPVEFSFVGVRDLNQPDAPPARRTRLPAGKYRLSANVDFRGQTEVKDSWQEALVTKPVEFEVVAPPPPRAKGAGKQEGGEAGERATDHLSGSVWKAQSKIKLRDGISALAASPDGRWLLVGHSRMKQNIGKDKESAAAVSVIDLAAGKEVAVVPAHAMDLAALAVSPDGRWVASVGGAGFWNNEVYIWSLAKMLKGSPQRAYQNIAAGNGADLAFSPDSRLLAAPGYDTQKGGVHFIDMESGKVLRRLETAPRQHYVKGVAFSADGKLLATAAGTVEIRDLKSAGVVRQFGVNEGSDEVALSPDGKLLAADAYFREGDKLGRGVKVWEVASGKAVADVKGLERILPGGLSFSAGGKHLVIAAELEQDGLLVGRLLFWDVAKLRLSGFIEHVGPRLAAAVLLPDGKTAALADKDGTVTLWVPDATSRTGGVPPPPPDPRAGSGDAKGKNLRVASALDGQILFVGTELKANEKAPDGGFRTIQAGGRTIRFRLLREGDRVEEGQVLAMLDDRLAQTEVVAKEARVRAAEAELRETAAILRELEVKVETGKRLVPQAMTREEFNALVLSLRRYQEQLTVKKAAVTVAEAELKSAVTLLEMHTIRSPVRGVVRAIHRQRGESVRKLETIFEIEVTD